MKKYIAWLLVFALSLSLFTGCKQNEQPSTEPSTQPTVVGTEPVVDTSGLESAIEYIRNVYKNAEVETPRDYTRISTVPVGTEKYDVVWTVNVGEDVAKVVSDGSSFVTIDVNENIAVATPYVLTATITDAAGNTRSYSWDHIVPMPVDYADVLDQAYALEPGEAMENPVTLEGVITGINQFYDPDFKNISVVIQVGDHVDKPILCYRLKGEGAETLTIGDTITVYGIIKNYNGTIEFDAGCELISVIKTGGEAPVAPEDPLQIVDDAYALGKGQSTPYVATLTGKVTAVKEPYTDQYKNITVVIKVEGRESKPITCYRIKGEKAASVNVNDIITVQGQITNYNGTIEFVSGSKLIDVVDKAPPAVITDLEKIWNDAQKLSDGSQLSYEAQVSGTITQVNYAYDPNYDNITVTIKLANGQTIGSRYMSGSGVDKIGVGDDIVVRGFIENYQGKRQFLRGEMIDYTINRTSAPSDPLQIVEDAYALAAGESLLYDAKLTGKVTEIDEPYTSQYKNATFTIEVPGAEDKPIVCYRAKGSDLSKLEIGDTITVKGTITNYNGTIEFTTGSQASNLVKGETEPTEPTEPTDPTDPTVGVEVAEELETGKAYKLLMEKDDTVLYFDGTTESETVTYRLNASEDPFAAVDVYLEAVEGVEGGYRLYFMNGETKTYIRVFHRTDGDPGYGKGSLEWVTEAPVECYTYDETAKTLIHTAEDGENAYYMGTYGTYVTFSVSNTSYITGDNAANLDVSQFPARLATITIPEGMEPSEPTEPSEPSEPSTSVVTSVETGKTYKWGIEQANLGKTLYFAGTMNGYYGATTENVGEAVDVVLEEAEGGYYVSFTDPEGAKKYVNVVVSGTHRNFTIADSASTVYTFDSENNTLLTDVEGTACYIGTYGTYNTFSVSTLDKIGTSFPSHFYVAEEGSEPEVPSDPTEPSEPSTSVVTSVEAGKTYKWGIEQDNLGKTLYFAGTMNGYYGATTENVGEAVDVVLEEAEGGYYVSFTDPEGAKKYVNVVVSGTHRNFTIADSASTVYTFDSENNTLLTDVEGTACYIGTYGTYNTFSVSTLDKIGTSFPSHFYVAEEDSEPEVPSDPTEPSEPEVPTEPSEPSIDPTPDSTLPVADAIALGASKDHNVYTEGKYYVTGEITEVYNTQYGNLKIKDAEGNILTVYGTYNADGTVRYDALEVKPVAGDTITVYGIIGQYNGTPQLKNGWITEHVPGESEPTEPTEPVVDPTPDSTLPVADAIALGASKDHNVYTEGKYYVTGEITEVYNTQYGNLKIKDAEGNILTVYGTYNADGTVRYDALEVKPVAGDTITVYGIIGQYNGTPQLKNGWITEHVPAESEPTQPSEPEATEPSEPEQPSEPAHEIDYETDPEVGVAYKLGLEQNNLGKVLYFAGEKSGNFLATTEDIEDAVDMYIEEVDGGFYMYFLDGETKKYVEMYEYSAGKVGVDINDEPHTVLDVDSQRKAIVGNVIGTDYYLGTYNTFNTISSSKISYIEDTSVIGVTQFPACFIEVEGSEPVVPPVTEPTEPEEETPSEMEQIVRSAYELAEGESMEGTQTLTGVITEIDSPYDPGFKNVSVWIVVEELEDMPILCYRIKGEGADGLKVDDTITVTGTLTNYKGTIEFTQGGTLDAVIDGGGETVVVPTDPKEIMDAAYALEEGGVLPYIATLTGEIISIDEAYSEQYGNVTFTIAVEGTDKSIIVFRLKGEGVESLVEGDSVTVSGTIKNYYGDIEITSCTLVEIVKA